MKEVKCHKCGEDFEDVNYSKETPLAERIYCNNCLDKMERRK